MAAASVVGMVEVDVRRSSDGKLVLSHDPLLSGLVVHETPWSQLSELDLGEGHHPVLLDEALAALPDTAVQLEVKNWPGDPGFEPDHRVGLETAERARPGDIVTGFNWETIGLVKATYPNVSTGLAFDQPISLHDARVECLRKGHHALIPAERTVLEPLGSEPFVYPWTVNDPVRAQELAELGVTGIITDDPGSMTDLFRSDQ